MKTNKKILYYAVVVAIAGFLFGFDTVVISGANLPIKKLWHTSDWFHGTFIMSMALWGTVAGALIAGYPTDRLGRKNTLVGVGFLYLASAVGCACAPTAYVFSAFRFLGGLGVGISSIAAPTYIAEISNTSNRGTLGALYQLNIVLGIVVAYLSNYLLTGVGGNDDWRYMMGIVAVPSVLYIILVLRISESPRWLLIFKRDYDKAAMVLKTMDKDQNVTEILEEINREPMSMQGMRLFSGKFRFPLLLAFMFAFFNQLSGINFILYYAPEILEKAGFGASDSLLSSISIGIANLVFTIIGMYLIDRSGRKFLMYIGSTGYIISLSLIAYGFYADLEAVYMLVFILLFIASHAIGQGAVIWVFLSEIFPSPVRAAGQAFGSSIHWIFAALVTLFGSIFINLFDPWKVFGALSCLMVLQLLFVYRLMPETKGKSLEDIGTQLRH